MRRIIDPANRQTANRQTVDPNRPNDLRPSTNHEDLEPNDPEPIWLRDEEEDYNDRGAKHIYDHSIASGQGSKRKWVQGAAGAFRNNSRRTDAHIDSGVRFWWNEKEAEDNQRQ
jgi:hypothetical protein